MSSKVDGVHVIGKGLCDFLLVISSNLGPISHRSYARQQNASRVLAMVWASVRHILPLYQNGAS